MKKFLSLILFSCSFFFAHAQKFCTIDDIRAGWTQKTITGVKDGNILTLVTAFNKTWHTQPATDLLKNPVTNESEGDAYNIVVDRPNGYVSAYELGDDGESFEACVWKRSNGHKLFAYVFQRMFGLSVHQIILFYDYDPAKGTLTPEQNELTRFSASYDHPDGPSGLVVTYHLPRQGKDVVVQEYLMEWYLSIHHVYAWDGMNHHFYGVNIDQFDHLQSLYIQKYGEFEMSKFTQYTLYDFDEDNNPELWLSSENGDYQAIYSIVRGNTEMVESTYYKTHFLFYPNTIGSAGGCGTGCFDAHYVVLKDSKPLHTFEDFQEWNFEKDEMNHTYSFDGKEVSVKEGERILESFGKSVEITPQFRPLQHEEK